MRESRDSSIPWASPAAQAPPNEPGPFRIRGFWWIWILSGLGGAGYGAFWSVQTLALTDLDLSLQTSAAVRLSGYLGVLIGVLLSAALADRFPKKRAFKVCQLSMATCSAIVGSIALAGFGPVVLICASYVVVGVSSGFSLSLIWGLVAELMPRKLLSKSMVMLSWAGFLTSGLGTLFTTLLIGDAIWDTEYHVAYFYAAGLFLITGLLTRRLPRYAGTVSFPGGFREAARFLIGARRLRALWLYGVVASGCFAVFSASVAVFAYFDLANQGQLGLLFVAQGGAGVLATIGLAFVISGKQGWRVLVLCSVLAALFCAAVAIADTFWPLLALMIPFGAASSAAALGADAIAMGHTKFGYFGRISALLFLGGSLCGTGVAVLGIAFGEWGQGRALVVGAGVVLLLASLLLVRTWRSTRHDSSPTDGVARAPSTGLIAEIASPQKSGEPNQSA